VGTDKKLPNVVMKKDPHAHDLGFGQYRLGKPALMEDETYSGKLKSLRRCVAEGWLDSPGKETALSVLDEMLFEAAGEVPPDLD
jgi:hypothetical protein